MDGTAKVAIATVLAALLTAGATIWAARIGLVRPSERQVVDSEKYKELVDSSAALTVQNGELNGRIRLLEQENKKLQQDIVGAQAKASLLQSQLQARPSEVPNQPPTFAIKQLSPEVGTAPPSAATSSPKTQRTEITLARQSPVVINDELTVTLNYVNRNGAEIRVNGGNNPYQMPGNRINVKAIRDMRCFLENMSISQANEEQQTARVDLVCTPVRG